MNKSINPVFNLDKSAKVGQRANLSRDPGSYLIAHWQSVPGVLLCLLDSQAYPPIHGVYFEDNRLNLLANREQLGGMFQPLRPGHLSDMDQAFDTGLQLYKRAVVRKAYNLASDSNALR